MCQCSRCQLEAIPSMQKNRVFIPVGASPTDLWPVGVSPTELLEVLDLPTSNYLNLPQTYQTYLNFASKESPLIRLTRKKWTIQRRIVRTTMLVEQEESGAIRGE